MEKLFTWPSDSSVRVCLCKVTQMDVLNGQTLKWEEKTVKVCTVKMFRALQQSLSRKDEREKLSLNPKYK